MRTPFQHGVDISVLRIQQQQLNSSVGWCCCSISEGLWALLGYT